MPNFILSLIRERANRSDVQQIYPLYGALWPETGEPVVNGQRCAGGTGVLLSGATTVVAETRACQWLRFDLSRQTPEVSETAEVLWSESIEIGPGAVLLRLDEVAFPPGACAYRHVHPGPGIRHLIMGGLRLEPDDHARDLSPGDSWFEPANAPVKATATLNSGKTSFVRFMVLPAGFEGRSTLTILDTDDASRPRLQRTHRHIDQIVQLDDG